MMSPGKRAREPDAARYVEDVEREAQHDPRQDQRREEVGPEQVAAGEGHACEEDRRHGAERGGDHHDHHREPQAEHIGVEELARLEEGEYPAQREPLRRPGQVLAGVESGQHHDDHRQQQHDEGEPGADLERPRDRRLLARAVPPAEGQPATAARRGPRIRHHLCHLRPARLRCAPRSAGRCRPRSCW